MKDKVKFLNHSNVSFFESKKEKANKAEHTNKFAILGPQFLVMITSQNMERVEHE